MPFDPETVNVPETVWLAFILNPIFPAEPGPAKLKFAKVLAPVIEAPVDTGVVDVKLTLLYDNPPPAKVGVEPDNTIEEVPLLKVKPVVVPKLHAVAVELKVTVDALSVNVAVAVAE